MATLPSSIDTPALVIDESTALDNIVRFQAFCDERGLKLRPHVKTHKTLHFAKAQIAAGAVGVTCQKLAEAEVMAGGGVDDMLLAFNMLGSARLERLRGLARKVGALRVVADNPVVAEGLASAFSAEPRPLSVMVECDTGGGRCGVRDAPSAVALAKSIVASSGLRFAGLVTYPAIGGQADAASFMKSAVAGLAASGIECPDVSSGGSPDMWTAATGQVVTEYRAGTYVYNDRSLVERGVCDWKNCAARVCATVVSAPAEGRAVIDAGTKTLTSDLLGLDGYGRVVGHPRIRIAQLSEEHGMLSLGSGESLRVGGRLWIVPNHACAVSNMFDRAWLKKKDGRLESIRIDARGAVT